MDVRTKIGVRVGSVMDTRVLRARAEAPLRTMKVMYASKSPRLSVSPQRQRRMSTNGGV